jgi:hypothetical protein
MQNRTLSILLADASGIFAKPRQKTPAGQDGSSASPKLNRTHSACPPPLRQVPPYQRKTPAPLSQPAPAYFVPTDQNVFVRRTPY